MAAITPLHLPEDYMLVKGTVKKICIFDLFLQLTESGYTNTNKSAMIFEEKQKFNQTWLWILMVIPGITMIGIFGIAFYKQIIQGQPFGNHPMSNPALFITGSLVILIVFSVFLLFCFSNLTTIIDKNEINLRFFPFHWSFRKYAWSSIERFEIITYKPISEYGGWGIRYGNKGKAYNIRGNVGLQLYFKNGKKILIGTQKGSELSNFLKNL